VQIGGNDVIARRFKSTGAFCNGQVHLRQRFLTGATKQVARVEECVIHCARETNSEVVQISRDGLCTCSKVIAGYLALFSRRYTECSSGVGQHSIFSREDRPARADLSSVGAPLLFFALDDVSEVTNLGSLDPAKYAPRWVKGSGHFDCPKNAGAKLMRLIPSESPLLQLVHDLNLSPLTGYTVMIWFKKRDPNTSQFPMLDNSAVQGTQYAWHMWNWPGANQVYWWNNAGGFAVPDVFNQAEWNHMAMRVKNGVVMGDVNGRQVGTANVVLDNYHFGDLLSFGRRQVGNDGLNANVFDGCLAHTIIYDKALSSEEVKLVSNLLNDDAF
jgi:hypothetical protein